ncbi:MAG: CHRD domain-containing protein [Methylacidiphilales bacterium]|nr:CHRD domain-containing protein [Candidatus Methylacidiphilales bacterium]
MKLIALLTVMGLAAASSLASAQTYDANLDPFQEVPPHNTPGYGSADLSFDTTTSTLSITAGTGVYADLLAGATTVRISDAPVGSNGPTVFLLNLDTPGNTSGTFSGSGTLTSAQITDLNNGNLYINIADSVFPSGEIRGQILATPEPSTWALLLGGLSLLAFGRLRARRTVF